MRVTAYLAVTSAAVGLAYAPLPAAANEPAAQPLSVIDWLGRAPAKRASPPPKQTRPAVQPAPDEPPVTKNADVPLVTVAPLGQGAPVPVGLVPFSVTGLPQTIWTASSVTDIRSALDHMLPPSLPAAQALLYSLVLTETLPPIGGAAAQADLTLARTDLLYRFGALDPALALLSQGGATASSAHLDTLMNLGLLTGTEDAACRTYSRAAALQRDYAVRVFCEGRAGNWQDAALLLDSARALSLMPATQADLLDRFLDPEAFEGEAPLPRPNPMTPLAFRLMESIGEPVPTGPLPRPFAFADLRDVAGWKAQLEAAERLAKVGALPDNRLLGLYTDRLPSASGGVWDRVEAVQRFETALRTRNPNAVAKTLPPAWSAMRAARLEVPFATLFADPLKGLPLSGKAAQISAMLPLLTAGYETAEAPGLPRAELMRAIAKGDVTDQRATGPKADAILAAFRGATPRASLTAKAQQKQLGLAILGTLALLEEGARGDLTALRDAIATLRALGLEDTARRAALQSLILERDPA